LPIITVLSIDLIASLYTFKSRSNNIFICYA
jgi:hypothetical protein